MLRTLAMFGDTHAIEIILDADDYKKLKFLNKAYGIGNIMARHLFLVDQIFETGR